MYILDTNIISELIKNNPEPKVINWLNNLNSKYLYLSVLTLGEIRKGIEKLNNNNKNKLKLTQWLEIELIDYFNYRIINIDQKIIDIWGKISAKYKLGVADALIAATALSLNYKLVTRNIKDFSQIDNLELVDPWDG